MPKGKWQTAISQSLKCVMSDVSDNHPNQHICTILVDQFHVTSQKKYCSGQQQWFTHQATLLVLGLVTEMCQSQSSLAATDDSMYGVKSYRVPQKQAVGTRVYTDPGLGSGSHGQMAPSVLVSPMHWGLP